MSVTSSAALDFAIRRNAAPLPREARDGVLADPGFGKTFTDHMVKISWTKADGWHDAQVLPYGPIQLEPSAAVLHYAQEIFEGMKAYRHEDGSIWTFRPDQNALRMQRSARRMALPELPVDVFLEAIRQMVEIDSEWVPAGGEKSLYLRPFMIASEPFLGVRSSNAVDFYIIASPAGPYFAGGIKPVSIWISEDYTRAAPGGTGAAKCGGNYGSSLVAINEATAQGCDQVCFLDAVERKYIDELGGMNVYVVTKDGKLLTPEVKGTILEGVTRDSILAIGGTLGLTAEERRISIDEVRSGIADGTVTEMFACGTAAVVTPIGVLKDSTSTVSLGAEPGRTTVKIREALLDIQYGRADSASEWMVRLV